MEEKNWAVILANFGGPRDLEEIQPFLTELLCDKDVLRTPLPQFLHTRLFSWIAKRRVPKIKGEYESMGGKSPIFFDTERLAVKLKERLERPLLTFHRYLPSTHREFIHNVKALKCDEVRIFPLFPQFTYATTGSLARWFGYHFPKSEREKFRWVKSYPAHRSFVKVHQKLIRQFLDRHQLKDEETILLFSAHGIPKKFVETGDIYSRECEDSVRAIAQAFPQSLARLSYQSKFGPGEWLKPYTIDVCKEIKDWNKQRQHVVFIPISFTSDHIETLCEIENDYMTVVREKGLDAYRVPSLTLDEDWIDAIVTILNESQFSSTQMLTY